MITCVWIADTGDTSETRNVKFSKVNKFSEKLCLNIIMYYNPQGFQQECLNGGVQKGWGYGGSPPGEKKAEF